MNDQRPRLLFLFQRFMQDECSDIERNELMKLLSDPFHKQYIDQLIEEQINNDVPFVKMDALRSRFILSEILSTKRQAGIKKMPYMRWVAAAVIVALAIGAYIFYQPLKTSTPVLASNEEIRQDIAAPSGSRAVLKLSDGREVFLDDVMSGKIAVEGNTAIQKTADGQLIYNANGAGNNIVYNTIELPRGSKPINISLSDRTKVWLNAGSAITFPVAFSAKERQVEITGEVYFEVAKNPSAPFTVNKKGGNEKIAVLGTSFNVNAYDDEPSVSITLIDGSVRVDKGSNNKILTPGQQAIITSAININNNADIKEVTAWKNGIYQFESAGIDMIMRQLARSYNISYELKGKIKETFGGTISRDVNLSQVLKMLETTGFVKFVIDGNKIIVYQE